MEKGLPQRGHGKLESEKSVHEAETNHIVITSEAGQLEPIRLETMKLKAISKVPPKNARRAFDLRRRYSVQGSVLRAFICGLTSEAKRPRLNRDDERSRVSKMLRENGRQCRRGPT